MVGLLGLVGYGLFRVLVLGETLRAPTAQYGIEGDPGYSNLTGVVLIVLLARAFSSGCAALTGVEAIANGVPAFREPKSRNAATTLGLLGLLSVTMLIGVTVLANLTDVRLIDRGHSHFTLDGARIEVVEETAIAQLARIVFDSFPVGFYFVLAATMVILFLAANTAFSGFPVLGSILAKDGYLPRQLHTRGDRLAYSNGIVLLALVACGLVLAFRADTTALIQLYVVGVFVSFTVSQLGMLRHWTRELRVEHDVRRRRDMHRSRVINLIGLTMTGVVLIIVLFSKFLQGAYLAVIAMVVLFVLMKGIRRHYDRVAVETALAPGERRMLPSRVHAIVLVSKLHKPTLRALGFAKATHPSSLEAVTVDVDREETAALVEQWREADLDVVLRVIASPYREVTHPILEHVRSVRSENPRDVVTVYIPEYVVSRWWQQVLHNQSALRLKARLLFTPGVMVTSVPYVLESSTDREQRMARRDTVSRRQRAWRRGGGK